MSAPVQNGSQKASLSLVAEAGKLHLEKHPQSSPMCNRQRALPLPTERLEEEGIFVVLASR